MKMSYKGGTAGMETTKTIDIRKVRTRHSIIEAFMKLLQQKRFEAIKISDITNEAMINRATFYYYFADKYELFEIVTRENLLKNIRSELAENKNFCENTLKNLFLSLTQFHEELSDMCTKSYEDLASGTEAILREEVEQVLLQALKSRYSSKSEIEIRSSATALSWMLYGAAYEWKSNSQLDAEVFFQQMMVSIEKIINE
ncbi:TetR/AcrR family transcriptional regulator [Marinilactibacillus sp. 15R]|uniref:TetR/AcrR family transcriptional regulator n=1 Tax=Marinilactibacillus sp. 15R TaxID=1911586 RepID=UPI0009F864EB|nr:TetR/AcrR family transcriptional regulator [Marinilactibacillus sp. 15R]